MPHTFYCLLCGLDKHVRDESDYEPDCCKDCTGEDD